MPGITQPGDIQFEMYIEKIGEYGLIRRIQSKFPAENQSIVCGIGDDAAVINPSAGKLLLLSTDTLREDIHFRKRYCTFYDIGWKAVAVSISDIAAMGGIPKYLLFSIAVPSRTSVKDLDSLLNGVADITTRYNVSLVGGNVSRAKGGVSIDTTVIGELAKGKGVFRSGASVGDLIYVTGRIGNSAMAFSLLKSSFDIHSRLYKQNASFISCHLRPVPRVREGVILGTHRLASAMIDISDGLLKDLGHICEQSKVGANIHNKSVPLPGIPDRLKGRLTKDPVSYALYGGEDYELLFTVKRKDKERLEKICKQEAIDATCIGEIVPENKGISIVAEDGIEKVLNIEGYDHFRTKRGKTCLKDYR